MISIIIPVYNTAVYLPNCIKSILAQTYTDFELLLIDDGSTDGSGDICDQYARIDQRIKVVHNKNHGVSYSRNFGLLLSTGEYIAFCDADDQYKQNYLMDMYNAAKNSSADIVICNYSILQEQSEKVVCGRQSGIIEKEEIYRRIFGDNTIGGFVWNKFFKKELIRNIRFDESMQICEDTYFVCHSLKKADKIYYVGNSLYLYRIHPNSTVNNIQNMFDNDGNLKYMLVLEKILMDGIVESSYRNYIKADECVLAINVKCDYLNSKMKINKKTIKKLNDCIKRNFIPMIICDNYSIKKKLICFGNALFNLRKFKYIHAFR